MHSGSGYKRGVLPLTSAGGGKITRRRLIGSAAAGLVLLVSRNGIAASTSVLAVRVWPARDYTRITIESREPLVFNHHSVRNPERLVVDLEGLELNSILQSLPTKITGQDPYIQLIRAGRNRPGVVRLVIELKDKVGALAVPVFSKRIVLPYSSPTKASRSPSPSRSAKAGEA